MVRRQRRPDYANHRLLPDVFSDAECERVIELGDMLPTEAGALEDGGGSLDAALRSATIAWLGLDAETGWVFERLKQAAERANQHFLFDLTGLGEDLQYTVYDRPGSFYTWHQDGLDGEVATRKLSLVVQLTHPTDYEGNELEFLDVAEDWTQTERDAWLGESQQRGCVIAFPAFEQHRVLPLRAGIRRSLVCWVDGPPFR